jgi:hypothetical protein
VKYTVYKTTNKINGKVYVGVHATENPDDAYLGSGKRFRYALAKYGAENFEKEVIAIYDNANDMYDHEACIVNEEFTQREDTYNIMCGGHGGVDYLRRAKLVASVETLNAGRLKLMEEDSTFREIFRDNGRKVGARSKAEGFGIFSEADESGKKWFEVAQPLAVEAALSPEARAKQIASFKRIGHAKGEKNSQFGTSWIMRPETGECKKVPRSDLAAHLEQGWVKGRKMPAKA